jgi:hypothetical protein
MTILLVGDLDFATKGQRFVRRRHGVIVDRDAAASFGSTLRSPTAYTDATQSSARTGMSSKQSTSAAINRRMRDHQFTSLDAPAASKIRGIAAKCCCKTPIS